MDELALQGQSSESEHAAKQTIVTFPRRASYTSAAPSQEPQAMQPFAADARAHAPLHMVELSTELLPHTGGEKRQKSGDRSKGRDTTSAVRKGRDTTSDGSKGRDTTSDGCKGKNENSSSDIRIGNNENSKISSGDIRKEKNENSSAAIKKGKKAAKEEMSNVEKGPTGQILGKAGASLPVNANPNASRAADRPTSKHANELQSADTGKNNAGSHTAKKITYPPYAIELLAKIALVKQFHVLTSMPDSYFLDSGPHPHLIPFKNVTLTFFVRSCGP